MVFTSYFWLVLAIFLCSLNLAVTKVHYITPSSDGHCVKQCIMLAELAANSGHYFSSNTTLVFNPGIHQLRLNLTVSNSSNVFFTSTSSHALIVCGRFTQLTFNSSHSVRISNVKFLGCGGVTVRDVETVMLQNSIFEGQNNSGTSLTLIETSAVVINCTFKFNINGSYQAYKINDYSIEYRLSSTWTYVRGDYVWAGGAVIAVDSNASFSRCTFENNRADFGGVMFVIQSYIKIDMTTFFKNKAGSKLPAGKAGLSYDFTFGGVIYHVRSHIDITNSNFLNNSAKVGGAIFSLKGSLSIKHSIFNENAAVFGGVLYTDRCGISIHNDSFNNNTALQGGVIFSRKENIGLTKSAFKNNSATGDGGVLYSNANSSITLQECSFKGNKAESGGVLFCNRSTVIMNDVCLFSNNHADTLGGVLVSSHSNIMVAECLFESNCALFGGVFVSSVSKFILQTSALDRNIATGYGGVLYSENSKFLMRDSEFTRNEAPKGAVIYADNRTSMTINGFIANGNQATCYGIIYFEECEGSISGNFIFSSNVGSLIAYYSNITLRGVGRLANNQPQVNNDNFQEGGAFTVFLSNIYFDGTYSLHNNCAQNGGAIRSAESKIYVNGFLMVIDNTATGNGGGIYLSNSEINCQSRSALVISSNRATNKGGGVHAIGSSIRVTVIEQKVLEHIANFANNTAEKGGGLSLESNSRLNVIHVYCSSTKCAHMTYSGNVANFGGAIFVNDETYTATCTRSQKSECFFQMLSLHYLETNVLKEHIQFSQNYARYAGSTLYGGLLDRCTLNPLSPSLLESSREKIAEGLHYFKSTTGSPYSSISSGPIKICSCIGNHSEHNSCNDHGFQQNVIKAKKGENFVVSIVAVDQVNHPVNATIQSSLKYSRSGLAEGQLTRKIQDRCTDLSFSVTSPHSYEELGLYASNGPCKDADLSELIYTIHFLPCECPIGFQLTGNMQSNCTCDCHRNISRFVICDIHRESFVRKYTSNIWINYDNSSGYLVYLNCPYDYCKPLNSTSVNLNQPNGADAQCAFNRSSLLCGSCEPGLSLSLGSSLCLSCPIYWPALLTSITIAAILAGIALVTLLLTLNMTVAVGTLNGLLLYVNILSANRSILLPFQDQNYITVLISWLNLELGIDTCYFDRMDTYTKTWIQLAFPFYIMFIVVLVIIISSHSPKFSKVIGKKDPVATLATLILFSYATLLQVIFRVFSFGTLTYADGTTTVVWLPDATVRYLVGKHIALFFVAVLILVIGLVYTVLVFSWQWLLRLPDWKVFKWSRYPRLQTFIETYHTPYTARHRYWTGLLLLVRVVLYLVAAVNVSNSPQIALTSISLTIGGLLFVKGFLGSLYKKWPLDLLESFFYFSILFLSIVKWYTLGDSESKTVYISVTITLIVLLIIILFHVYFHTSLFAKLHDKKFMTQINSFFRSHPPPSPRPQSPPPDEDTHRFHQLLDIIDRPANTNDYELAQRQQSAKPTRSVVEIHQPLLQPNQN